MTDERKSVQSKQKLTSEKELVKQKILYGKYRRDQAKKKGGVVIKFSEWLHKKFPDTWVRKRPNNKGLVGMVGRKWK